MTPLRQCMAVHIVAGVAWPGCAMLTVHGRPQFTQVQTVINRKCSRQCTVQLSHCTLYSNAVKEEALNNEGKIPLQELEGLRGEGLIFERIRLS